MSESLPPLPTAVLRPARRISPAWLIPLAAALFVAWLGWRAWLARGVTVIVQLEQGHGLKSGDDVRYRGIAIGVVDDVALADDLRSIEVTARLVSQADRLARSGARFWVVRPELGLTRIEGLDTIIGPRFLAVLPSAESNSRPQRRFVGLAAPPIVDNAMSGDLEIVLEAPQRGSLVAGAPVYYRQTRIGSILSVGLAGDGGSVEARAHIHQPYVPLVRQQTRFWDAGGISAEVGITGFSIDIDSAEAVFAGGVALATPPNAGEIVRTGHRFRMDLEPKEEWRAWKPAVAIGNSLLPSGEPSPAPLRARLAWEQGRIISSERSRQGWVLQTDQGLLGPADLLVASDKAERESAVLEVGGQAMPLQRGPAWQRHGLAMLEVEVPGASVWSSARLRAAGEPEECVAIADSIASPLPLAAARLSPVIEDGRTTAWRIDPLVAIDESWHGASVLSRADGRVLGILLVEDKDQARVALLAQ